MVYYNRCSKRAAESTFTRHRRRCALLLCVGNADVDETTTTATTTSAAVITSSTAPVKRKIAGALISRSRRHRKRQRLHADSDDNIVRQKPLAPVGCLRCVRTHALNSVCACVFLEERRCTQWPTHCCELCCTRHGVAETYAKISHDVCWAAWHSRDVRSIRLMLGPVRVQM